VEFGVAPREVDPVARREIVADNRRERNHLCALAEAVEGCRVDEREGRVAGDRDGRAIVAPCGRGGASGRRVGYRGRTLDGVDSDAFGLRGIGW
jgi:hypothetical protein